MQTPTTLIKNGRVIDPSQGLDKTTDVVLADGKVRHIGGSAGMADRVIDAAGLIVCPGLIDMHVHLREPGNEDAETIATGAASAVAGGFTTVACMPNTDPPLDNEASIEFVYRQASRANLCNVYPIGAITKGRAGKELAEIGQMVRAGAVAFSDDGCGVADTTLMLRALQYVSMFDRPLIQHCEDASLAADGCMNSGTMATKLGLPGIPAEAESLMVQRDITLAEKAGAVYHMAHISTTRAVEAIRDAKRRGLPITAEVTPHHLLMTDEVCRDYETRFKVNPPLRSAADRDACIEGVIDGTIDCLCTDHAPHGAGSKELPFQDAPFGMVGLETALAMLLKALVEPGHVGLPHVIRMLTQQPARVLSLPKGTLREGADADVTLFDPDASWTVDAAQFVSRSRNTPFEGWEVRGRVVTTIVSGDIKFQSNGNGRHSTR